MPNLPTLQATRQLARWSTDIARCFDPARVDKALARLGAALKNLVPHDFTTCVILNHNAAPLTLLEELPRDVEPVPFEETPYVLDPLYQHLEAGTLPVCCSLRDIMPDAFEESDYFRYYYDHAGEFDEYSFNIPLANGGVCHVAMTRSGESRRFAKHEQSIFIAVEPLVRLVILHYLKSCAQDLGSAYKAAHSFHVHLNNVLQNFGTSILTKRESEVVRMTLKGYSDKLAAEKLGLQPNTFRNHKKNIYRKLGITSQGQVFGLLLKALELPPADIAGKDALAMLMDLPDKSHSGPIATA